MISIHNNNRRTLVSRFYDDLLSVLKIIESTAFGSREVVMFGFRGLVTLCQTPHC